MAKETFSFSFFAFASMFFCARFLVKILLNDPILQTGFIVDMFVILVFFSAAAMFCRGSQGMSGVSYTKVWHLLDVAYLSGPPLTTVRHCAVPDIA